MKILKLLLICAFCCPVFACSYSAATKSPKPCSSDENWYKYVQLDVVKVYSAKDGNAIYKSYLVKWEDQEVIVNDTLARTNYKEGNAITVVAMAHSYLDDSKNYGLLSFEIAPPEVVEN